MDNKNLVENTKEKSLVLKGESRIKRTSAYLIKPLSKTTTGVIFYCASFVVSIIISYVFIFSLFN